MPVPRFDIARAPPRRTNAQPRPRAGRSQPRATGRRPRAAVPPAVPQLQANGRHEETVQREPALPRALPPPLVLLPPHPPALLPPLPRAILPPPPPTRLMLEPTPDVPPVAPPRKRRKNNAQNADQPHYNQTVFVDISNSIEAFVPPTAATDTTEAISSASQSTSTTSRPSRVRKSPSRNKDFVPTTTRSKNISMNSSRS